MTIANPRIVVQLYTGEFVQRLERARVKGRQLIVVQLQTFQQIQPAKPFRLDFDQLRVRQVQLHQIRCTLERVRVDPLQGIVGEYEVPEERRVQETGGRDYG